MFLTRALMFYVRRRKVPGRLDTGKYQIVKRVTPAMKRATLNQLFLERDNLEVLDNPWLTQEEERGHMVEKLKARFLQECHQKKVDKMLKHRHMDEHLNHLLVSKKWE